jgi:hypothetical protein
MPTDYVKNSETHQNLKKMITTRPIMLTEPGIMASVDLIDVSKYAALNDGYTFILTYIDLFSKWVDARPPWTRLWPMPCVIFYVTCLAGAGH